jgi:hypothetical protein
MVIVADGLFGAGEEIDQQPSIVASTRLESGGFVLVWQQGNQYSGPIFASIYDATGALVGAPIAVAGTGSVSDVVALSSGGFAIAWMQQSNNYYSRPARMQSFDAAGQAIGAAVTIAESTNPFTVISALSLAVRPDGYIAVSWTVGDSAAPSRSIRATVVDESGSSLTPIVSFSQGAHAISGDLAMLADGRALIPYDVTEGGPWFPSVAGPAVAIYDPVAEKITGDFIDVPVTSGYTARGLTVTNLASGEILLTWGEYLSGEASLRGQIYSADGLPLGTGFQTGVIPGFYGQHTVAALENGGFAIAYQYGSASDPMCRFKCSTRTPSQPDPRSSSTIPRKTAPTGPS